MYQNKIEILKAITGVLILILLMSCTDKDSLGFDDYLLEQKQVEKYELKHAEKFQITEYEKFIQLNIDSFSGNGKKHRYILSEDNAYLKTLKTRFHNETLSFIKIPVVNVVSLSSQNIAFIDALNLLKTVKGIDLRRNISNSFIQNQIAEDKVYELGEGRDIDLETVKIIQPDLVLSSGTGGEYDAGGQFNDDSFVLTYEWLEKTPLARAEWIKCIALFYGKSNEADVIFSSIEDNYKFLKNHATLSEKKVSVLVNMVYGDSWAVPGGRSFAANLFKDANIIYPWSSNKSEGSLFLDFESVLSKGADVDIWLINSQNINTTDEIIQSDKRYELFDAIKSGRVYNNNRNTGRYGNPYWEEGILYPDRVLSDLIKIFHPEVQNNNPFYYYKKMSTE